MLDLFAIIAERIRLNDIRSIVVEETGHVTIHADRRPQFLGEPESTRYFDASVERGHGAFAVETHGKIKLILPAPPSASPVSPDAAEGGGL